MKYFSLLMIAGVLTLSACNNGNNAGRTSADSTSAARGDVDLSAKEVLDEAAPNMKNPVDSFTMTTPKDWKRVDTTIQKIRMHFITAPEMVNGFRSNIVVVSEDMLGLPLDKYFIRATEWLKKGLKEDYKELSQGDLVIDSVPAKVLKFETSRSKVDIIAAVYVIAKGNTAYTVTCMTAKDKAPENLPVFQNAVSSFKFK